MRREILEYSGVEIKNLGNVVDIDHVLMRNRIIYFDTPVTARTSSLLIKKLLYLDAKNTDDIVVYINSPGGSIYSGFAVLDVMEKIKSNIVTIGLGLVASFATVLLLSGTKNKRKATKNCRIMIHQPLTNLGDKTLQATDLEIHYQELDYLKKKLYQFMSEKTGTDLTKLTIDCERDRFLSPEQSLEYGIIDHIL